jgi:glycyl-tRNA synthetase beta chain
MPDLLFELGCEELPASAVRRAYTQLAEEIALRLREATLEPGDVRVMGTPRRLIVGIANLPDRQADAEKETRGPGLAGAFDADGKPTKALEGFCRGQGVDPATVEQRDGYVWVRKHVAGQATRDLLAEILPASVRALTFDKSMRWGTARMRFARPIRWILAAFGGEVVPFEIEGVASGLASRGHRFYAPQEFEARSFDTLVSELRKHFVEPDAAEREATIRAQAVQVASGAPEMTDALVDENVFLTEWPTALEGAFADEFLVLPDSVLVTAMAKHERFFPVRDGHGALTNKFVSIRNAGEDAAVRAGNAWVLNARFNDAKFFYEEDKKHRLDDFLAATDRMTFQEKLGSVRQRAERLAHLAEAIAPHHANLAAQAARYAKADLSTGLVNELSSLQGIVGGDYARREGMAESVVDAIGSQYDLQRLAALTGESRTVGTAVFLADQIDKLVGYLGLGLAPSGSSDPFGLRRCATYLIEAAHLGLWEGGDFSSLVVASENLYLAENQPIEPGRALELLAPIFLGRYEAMLPDVRYDIREAATAGAEAPLLDPVAIRARIETMTALAANEGLVATLTRPVNLTSAALKKGEVITAGSYAEVAEDRLDSVEGVTLLTALRQQQGTSALDRFRSLEPLLHAFFESTMIMVEDADTRAARLALIKVLSDEIGQMGDLSRLVFEGHA